MVFTSFKFLVFIALVFLGYFLLPRKARWVWLLISSAYFYLCTGVKYSVFLLLSIASAYLFGLYCGRLSGRYSRFLENSPGKEEKKAYKKGLDKRRKLAAALTLLLNLGVLGFLKYAGFALENLAKVVRLFAPSFETGLPELALPLGISFYTFMAVSYCVDVYREVSEPERDPFKLALFLSFFPHIMQGPIDRYEHLAPQLYEGHPFDYERMTRGLGRMLWGFFQKLVIADRLGLLVDNVFAHSEDYSGLYLAAAVFFYAVQIYADFAGYMDIALGASNVLGIAPAENFDAPYLSRSIPEFWRRWHMTLGSWFREYLFYPVLRSGLFKKINKALKNKLGKSACGTLTTCLALGVVWFTTGLWHGASWHYIAWGLYYGGLIILSTVTKPLCDRAAEAVRIDRESWWWRLISTGRTFLLVLIGYVFFRAANTRQAVLILSGIFTRFLPCHNAPGAGLGIDRPDLCVAVIGCLILLAADLLRVRGTDLAGRFRALPLPVRWAVLYAGIGAVLVFGIYGPGYEAASFAYFDF